MDQEVATKRLAIIAAYLQAVLEEPRLCKNLDVQIFLEQGQARVAEAESTLVTNVRYGATNTYAECTMARAEDQDRSSFMADGASAVGVADALSPPAALGRSHIHHLVRPQTKEALRKKRAQHFSQTYDVRAWLLIENYLAPALGVPPPLAARIKECTCNCCYLMGDSWPPFSEHKTCVACLKRARSGEVLFIKLLSCVRESCARLLWMERY